MKLPSLSQIVSGWSPLLKMWTSSFEFTAPSEAGPNAQYFGMLGHVGTPLVSKVARSYDCHLRHLFRYFDSRQADCILSRATSQPEQSHFGLSAPPYRHNLVQYPSFLRSVGFVVPLLLSQDVVSNTLLIHGYLLIGG